MFEASESFNGFVDFREVRGSSIGKIEREGSKIFAKKRKLKDFHGEDLIY